MNLPILTHRSQELRDSDEWNFQAKISERNSSPFPSGKSAASHSSFTAKTYLKNYDVDRRSIFVANLPANTTESQVHDLFDNMGHIVNITINRRPSVREGTFKIPTPKLALTVFRV